MAPQRGSSGRDRKLEAGAGRPLDQADRAAMGAQHRLPPRPVLSGRSCRPGRSVRYFPCRCRSCALARFRRRKRGRVRHHPPERQDEAGPGRRLQPPAILGHGPGQAGRQARQAGSRFHVAVMPGLLAGRMLQPLSFSGFSCRFRAGGFVLPGVVYLCAAQMSSNNSSDIRSNVRRAQVSASIISR
jgi:hypothetical protein